MVRLTTYYTCYGYRTVFQGLCYRSRVQFQAVRIKLKTRTCAVWKRLRLRVSNESLVSDYHARQNFLRDSSLPIIISYKKPYYSLF